MAVNITFPEIEMTECSYTRREAIILPAHAPGSSEIGLPDIEREWVSVSRYLVRYFRSSRLAFGETPHGLQFLAARFAGNAVLSIARRPVFLTSVRYSEGITVTANDDQ